MNYYACIAAAVLLILPLLGLFPAVRWNSDRSTNGWFKIHMRSPQYYVETSQSMLGVYAQERVELYLRWLLATLFMLPIAASPAYPFTPVGFIIAVLIVSTRAWFRQSEIIGHSTEAYVAAKDGGFNYDFYVLAEATRTVANQKTYSRAFPGWTPGRLADAMHSRRWLVRILVGLHTVALKRMKRT